MFAPNFLANYSYSAHPSHQLLIKLVQDRFKTITKQLICFHRAAFVMERYQIKITSASAETRGDVVFDHDEPFHLRRSKFPSQILLPRNPSSEFVIYRLIEGNQQLTLPKRKPNQ